MATDINEQISNMYRAAQAALNDDLKQNFYSAVQARNTAFRQLNNSANARHAMYSGMPAASMAQYDASTLLPGASSMAMTAIKRQTENQEQWDKYMAYVKDLNEQADYYNKAANQLRGTGSTSTSSNFENGQ